MSTSTSPHPTSRREDGRPPSFAELLLRRWAIVLLGMIAVGAVGAAYGSGRAPTYDAQAQLIVGPAASSPQALTGTADASVTIASNYARLGNTQPILRNAAERLRLAPEALAPAVTVTSVSRNPLVRITAQAGSEAEATRIAAGYSQSLRRAIAQQISPERLGRAQLQSYSESAERLVEAQTELRRLRLNDAPRSEIEAATTEVNTAQLEAETAGNIYSQARQAAQSVTGLAAFDEARVVGDDRTDLLLRWTAIGVAAGALLGLFLASLLALRRARVLRRAL